LSSSGSTISSNGGISTGFSSIGNLSNEDNYHLLLRNSDTLFSIGLPSWEFPAPESYVLLSPPVIIDLDNDGKEEVMLLASEHGLTSTNRFLCLNHDGILRWDQAFQFNSPNFPTPCILNQITTLILSNSQNKIYYAVEYGNNLLLSDSIAIPFCINIDHNHLIADINQDGVAELVFKCRLSDFMTTSDAIAVVNLETKSISIKTLDPKKSYYFYGLSDINNDGNMEIITREQGTGIYILNYALDSLIFISEPNLYGNAFATGDFNQDGKNDIVCAIKINGRNYLRIYESTGYLLYTVPTYSAIDGLWISDIDKDEEIEIICCSTRELYVINVPNTGNTIGWPGQRGTIRNTGTALQPAYYKSNDTVYWADNILIPGSFEIPYGSTVIIKPGTHVFATEGAEFLVNGKLIAKGTENHNIQIRANIITSANNYWGGITAQTNGVVDLEYCRIENAEVGLFMYSRSPGNLKHNIFINNRVGVCTYANSPNIIGNYFNVNEIAVASHASSTPRFVGGAFSNIPYFNGLIDNDTAIAIYNSLPIVKKGKNDIYNSSNGVYMIFINDFPVNKLNVNNNYYGSSDTSVVIAHFIPSNKFIISPLLDSAQTNFKQITFDPYEELLQQAFYQFEQQQYEPAAQMFQNFIMQYPDSYLSLYAVTGEYLCYMYGEMQWEDFVQNMEYLLQDSLINTSIEKYAFEYKNLALRNKKDFAAAIDNYEKMLTQPVSYYDSLYAAINLAHTILESGLYKTSAIIADLDQQLIADDFSHVVRTKELLFSVPKDVNAFDPGENCLNIINLYPNPAHYSFSIDFSACDNGSMLIELYSANGRKVLQKTLKYKSGINQFTFDIESGKNKKINSGLYIVKLSSGSSEKTEKILLW
jgi:hypothetical protein